MSQQGQVELSNAAIWVRRRLRRIGWLRWIGGSHWIAGLTGLLAVAAVRALAGWRDGEIWVAVAVLATWLAAGGIVALIRRPSRLRSLAIWDEKAGTRDLFSSAFAFTGGAELAAGQKLHVDRALERLPAALPEIRRDLPFPSLKWAWILPAALIGFALSPLLRPRLDAGDALLTGEMVAEAERQAAELEVKAKEIEKIKDLTEQQKREIQKLREEVKDAAEDLADTDGKTAREVLAALEERARAAEKIAEKLGSASDEWASEEMLREMSQHADTADLAATIRDKDAEKAADESDAVADVLDAEDIKLDTQNRITVALERTMGKATDEDHTKPVGERVGNASRKMGDKQPKTAAREFEELAKHFRLVKKREEAQEKLKKLAEQLREAGSSISGSKLQKMQKLAQGQKGAAGQQGQPAPQGLQPLSQNPLQNMPGGMTPMQTGQTQPGSGQQQSLPIPGMQSPLGQGMQPGQKGQAMPVPGSGQKGKGQAMGLAAGQQGNQGAAQGMALSAPIPGMAPGAMAPGANLGAGAGAAASGMNGGLEAGEGTAGLGNQSTEAIKATQDAKVVAQTNQDGDSTIRAVQGQARPEQAARERQEMAVDFIKVQEEALDEKALPLSRREHVQRYFTALRKRFEQE